MAGSYPHLLGGWSMIENMGDAYETVEELFWLVQSQIGEEKAKKLLSEKFYPMARNEIEKDEAYKFIKKRMSE
jgi:hypothetical protein